MIIARAIKTRMSKSPRFGSVSIVTITLAKRGIVTLWPHMRESSAIVAVYVAGPAGLAAWRFYTFRIWLVAWVCDSARPRLFRYVPPGLSLGFHIPQRKIE